MSLAAERVSWEAGGTIIIDRVSARIEPGSTFGLLGPNGSGKSSLLRLLAGLRRPAAGAVLVDDLDIAGWGRRDLARRIAVVEQQVSTEIDLTVTEVVALGRTPHRSGWGGAGGGDAAAVTRALERTELEHLAHRKWHSLSGGERQRAQIARALAQEPSELLLDEPTNHLDIAHQLALLDLVRRLPVTGVVALHDLNLAAMFCDELMVLAAGRVVAAGAPADVLTEDLVRDVYGVRCSVSAAGPGEPPHVRFLPGPTTRECAREF
ncbi:ABC transporter ATP-binding protein [Qaidamihabitans albus]|uniref:ABC transporter ATP-binding protein n=1 Tax=Qaidamihabitans albus TaxID=2795733 RepID=UPI0018F24FA3|nr:ABC transporter ATP-binding protein [Qaidamihabitans albus]